MKHWQNHLFPVIMLAVLAGLSFWLEMTVDHSESDASPRLSAAPDAIAENFVVRAFDEQGRVRYRLSAPQLTHFGADDSALIQSPTLVYQRPDASPLTLSGKQAKVIAKGETIFLWDGVTATRNATESHPAMVASMPDLTVQPDAGTAFTGSPVEVNQGASWIRATGLHIDNNTATLVLQSAVTGAYQRPREQP